jgi:tRNA(Ile)-lysidine synthase
VVAVSGGVDSACLLTALAQAPCRSLPVRAVHVDHGLQPAAADFRRACRALCDGLDVPLQEFAVTVESRGVSIEASARDARYRALSSALRAGECLLTAHHARDQAETLLLQLLRGAGLKGLSAMPACRPLGLGWHVRPLLEVAHEDLRAFAAESGVGAACVADPMNVDLRFDRAYVRSELWPVIERRWPGAAKALTRTAGHVAEAQSLLDEAAAAAVQRLRDGNALSVAGLRVLPRAQQCQAVRHWIAAAGVTPPSTSRLQEALRQAVDAEESHQPAVLWGDHALRRYRERLFLTSAVLPGVTPRSWAIDSSDPSFSEPLYLGEELGSLRWVPQAGGLDPARLPAVLSVRRRTGGERLKPRRGARTQSVQHLCQSLGLLPWMRDALPLVYAGDALIAIGDLWQDARWCVADAALGLRCVWQDAPILV